MMIVIVKHYGANIRHNNKTEVIHSDKHLQYAEGTARIIFPYERHLQNSSED